MRQVLKGGLADRKSPSNFAPRALREGRRVESEHTSNKQVATEIAMDHLTEDPRYYEKLKKIEKRASVLSFMDELEKISQQKEANAFTDTVKRGAQWAGKVPGRVARYTTHTVPNQIGQAGAAFLNPVDSFKRGWTQTWHPQKLPGGKPLHPAFKALMALGLVQGTYETMKPTDPTGMGRSRLQRGLQFAGQQAGGYISAPFGMAGGMVGSAIGDRTGAMLGSTIDRIRGYRPPAAPPPNLPPRPQGMNDQVP